MAADGNGPDPYLAGEEGAAWTGLSAPERGERAARPESSRWVEEQGVHDQNRWEVRGCVAASNLHAREELLLACSGEKKQLIFCCACSFDCRAVLVLCSCQLWRKREA
jgi:hypothetical protein